MSHAAKILQAMREMVWYRAEDLEYLGIQRSTISAILKQFARDNIVDHEDEGFRKRKVYKTKQRDMFRN